MPPRGSWSAADVVAAFLAGEPLKALCVRVGGSPNTIRQVLKAHFGDEQFRALRDRNDPKKSVATEDEILAPFHTDEAFKSVATRLGMSPNTLRDKWVRAFGKDAFDARSLRLHSAAGARAGTSWKGKHRISPEVKQKREIDRGVDRRCPVCGVGAVSYQGLVNHLVRSGDAAHLRALEVTRKETESAKWSGLQELIDYVTCKECGLRAPVLTGHIRTHALDADSYRQRWGSDTPLWAAKSKAQHHEAVSQASSGQAYSVHEDALLNGDPSLWDHTPEAEKWSKVNSVLSELRGAGFPTLASDSLGEALTRLQKVETKLDAERVVRPYSTIGTSACASFFPNRFHAKRRGDRSAWEMWHDDSTLRKAIRLQLDSGHPTTPERVLKAVVMFSRTPSVFRPVMAKHMYSTYCPKGGVVWDPCAGYGGRLLGAMSAGVGKYIATDLEPETVKGNVALAKALGEDSRCRVLEADASSFDPAEDLDFVFTSPPYYDLEVYGEEFENSLRALSVEQWAEAFLGSIIDKSFLRLKVGGYLALNLPENPVSGLRLDLAADTLAKRAGFTPVEPIYMPVRGFKNMKREPILVWQKSGRVE